MERNIGILRHFERAVEAGKIGDLAGPGLGVEPFGIARFAHLQRGVDVGFEKADVGGDFAGDTALVGEGGDERDNDDQPCIGHQPRHLGHTADVLHTCRVGEAEILVEPVPDVVAVEDVGMLAFSGEPFFEWLENSGVWPAW